MFAEVRRSLYATTSTSGFSAVSACAGRLGLRHADAIRGVEDLPLQVRVVDDVLVDDADRADAGRGQVQAGGRAEAARADHQHLRGEQLQLARLAHLGDQDVAAVAAAAARRRARRHGPRRGRSASSGEAAGERRDVLVAELLQRLGGERRARAGLARDDHRRAAIGHGGLDARLQVAARDVHRALDRALLELVGLAHVDQHRRDGRARAAAASRGSISSISPFTRASSSR